MEQQNIPYLDKPKLLAGMPMKVLNPTPKIVLKTSYAYWFHNNNKVTTLNPTGGKIKPMIAREIDGAFQVWKNGAWVTESKNTYWYTDRDEKGNDIIKDNGQPKRGFYFDTFYEYHIAFDQPQFLEVWSKAASKMQVEEIKEAKLRIKTSLNKRVIAYMSDPRNDGTSFEITFDKDASPVDMYGVRYVPE